MFPIIKTVRVQSNLDIPLTEGGGIIYNYIKKGNWFMVHEERKHTYRIKDERNVTRWVHKYYFKDKIQGEGNKNSRIVL